MELVRTYGQYKMTLKPFIKLDHNNEVVENESAGHITMYDNGEKLPLVWSKTFPIKEAHAALKLFEGIGFYPLPF